MKGFIKQNLYRQCVALFLCILQTIYVVFGQENPGKGVNYNFPDKSKTTGNITMKISKDDPNIKLYGELIDILCKLNILTPSSNVKDSCFTLDRIVREVKHISTDSSKRKIGVYLYFQENQSSTTDTLTNVRSIADNSKHKHNSNGDASVNSTYPANSISYSHCNNSSTKLHIGLDSLSMKQDDSNSSVNDAKVNDESKGDNITGAVVAAPSTEKDKTLYGRLSRTQVVVIATCSAVIGTFFLIAAVMRIRNYVKRYRELQAAAGNRQDINVVLHQANPPRENRRDSSSSKASRQSNPAVKAGGVYVQISGKEKTASPRSSSAGVAVDQPLISVTTPSARDSPSSSHGSIDFIDEVTPENNRKKHMSDTTDITDEEEDHPLLRKSPDSGSSGEFIVSHEREVSPEEDVKENASKLLIHRDSYFQDDEYFDQPNPIVGFDPRTSVSAPLCNTMGRRGIEEESSSTEDVPSQQISNGIAVNEVSRDLNDIERQQNGTKTTNENKGNLIEDLPEPCVNGTYLDETNIADLNVVTIGLTQSETSLSDNPSYSYGNQVGYGFDFGYGNCAYSCPYQFSESGVSLNYNFFDLSNDACKTSSFVENGDLSRNNGFDNDVSYGSAHSGTRGVSPSSLSLEGLSISKANSGEPLLVASTVSSTESSGDMQNTEGADNPALVDSGEEDMGSGCRKPSVQSQIIPLALYEMNSPYSMQQ